MKKVWLISGAVMGLFAGATVAACSSGGGGTGGTGGSGTTTSTNATTNSTTNSTTTTTTTTGGGMGGSTTSSTTTTSTTSTGGTMCSTPGTLHPPKLDAGPGTIYCPFSAMGDGGKNEYCMPGTEHCCETPQGATMPSSCQPSATACMTGTGYTDWQCEDPVSDCPSGQDCCAAGATLMLGGTVNGMQCANFASKMHGTACVAAGSCVGIQMCTSDAECPAGKTCTPFSKAGNQVGGCM